MKKWIKALLISGMVLSLGLTGCASNTGNAGNSGNNGGAPQEPAKQTELIVSAAASLKNALDEIQKDYAAKGPNVKLTFNMGASGTLQQQIEQGAPADLFISAGKSQVDALLEKNLMDKDSVVNLLGNDLVLVVGANDTNVTSIQDLPKESVQKIGIGTPESVPAGKYAKEAFTSLKLWDTLEPKFVMAKDVTQVLNYVETGNAEAGVVYKSDAQGSTKVKVVEAFPADSHKAITYPAGIVSATKEKEAAEAFLTYLKGSDAQDIFAKYGFKTNLSK
ncbi:MAG TPA: molybdate ABC transporter substrate-binding protein [Desulfitobacterium dehalogenans]|uniref:Molybdate ABC transporter substrate-binding protein n=1 Tax=Desulfitobacterium dehalogenans TaxID=36854 RepID=A0A7C7D6R8_9FIRM|nr:molybdate ABC transporter substrate-binding protein [Desulfitobacterium dehalogenans]